jgi:GNAT superfamily N-acetyltransferase
MPIFTSTPILNTDSPCFQEVKDIYLAAFGVDERIKFEELLQWLGRKEAGKQGRLWAFQDGARTVAMGSAMYFPEQRMGYLPYLAVRGSLRGRGYGRLMTEFLLEWIRQRGREQTGKDPRMAIWDVRDPDETTAAAEKAIRNRRIDFYCRLGAESLPIAYTYPPVAEGQPAVADRLMVYTYPPGGRISRQDALDVAWVGLIVINHYTPDSIYFKDALASIDRNWPEA